MKTSPARVRLRSIRARHFTGAPCYYMRRPRRKYLEATAPVPDDLPRDSRAETPGETAKKPSRKENLGNPESV